MGTIIVSNLISGDRLKKIIFVILILFMCTSCSVEYNLNINSYNYDENLYLTENHKKVYNDNNWNSEKLLKYHQQMIDMELDQPTQIDYYTLEHYFELLNSGARLFVKGRSIEDYPLMIYRCYSNYSFENVDNTIILKTSNDFLCSSYLESMDEVKLNIFSDFDLIETNANESYNGKYTWDIKNNDDKNIYLKLKINENKKIVEERVTINWNFISLIVGIFLGIIFVTILVIYLIKKNVNKI